MRLEQFSGLETFLLKHHPVSIWAKQAKLTPEQNTNEFVQALASHHRGWEWVAGGQNGDWKGMWFGKGRKDQAWKSRRIKPGNSLGLTLAAQVKSQPSDSSGITQDVQICPLEIQAGP